MCYRRQRNAFGIIIILPKAPIRRGQALSPNGEKDGPTAKTDRMISNVENHEDGPTSPLLTRPMPIFRNLALCDL
jgi:hypothetical protein